jgi:hypothetical protein
MWLSRRRFGQASRGSRPGREGGSTLFRELRAWLKLSCRHSWDQWWELCSPSINNRGWLELPRHLWSWREVPPPALFGPSAAERMQSKSIFLMKDPLKVRMKLISWWGKATWPSRRKFRQTIRRSELERRVLFSRKLKARLVLSCGCNFDHGGSSAVLGSNRRWQLEAPCHQ